MEHSFEEGVMCGMLLAGNNKSSSSSAKNQILKAVDENGISIATFKITERYKLVCMAYYNNTYRLPNITPQLLKSRVDDTIIKPYAKPSDAQSCAFPDSHIETYSRPCEGIYIFNVMYDNDKPMWATSPYRFVVTRNVSTKWIYVDKRKSGFIKYPDDYAVNVKYDYCKEFVYWYRESYNFLLDKIEYKGNYTFDAKNSGWISGISSPNVYVDESGNSVSSITCDITYEKTTYSSTDQTYVDEYGQTQVDYSKRPIISVSDVSELTRTLTIKNSYLSFLISNVNMSYEIYSDLNMSQLLELDHNIIDDIYKTYELKRNYSGDWGDVNPSLPPPPATSRFYVKKAVCLN